MHEGEIILSPNKVINCLLIYYAPELQKLTSLNSEQL
jgi:hypothetical protein